jgi:CubicO group peptidase (beta-lactamase class C family)
MTISRRGFTGGALSLAFAGPLATPTFAQASAGLAPRLAPALAAIRAYGEATMRAFGLPGLTLAVMTPDGFSTVLDFGFSDVAAKRPIASDTLFQIGSISKLMTAALVHQFAAEGRLRLGDFLSDVLPGVPLPADNGITIQHLLDHVSGLPDDAPTYPEGGLWTGFRPGSHWSYSNTGYDILGKLLEHVGGKPLGDLLQDRLLGPLGMTRSKGAILDSDRALYAQGYEAGDRSLPYVRGTPLVPAPWVDVTFGAGSVASTGADMVLLMRSLLGAARGSDGLGLPPEQARAFAGHKVPTDTPGMTYGNGLMHVANAGRAYLHHTGGMVSFSSSFTLDLGSGVGAFASTNLSAFAEYRPRMLAWFAVDALSNALAGRPLPMPPRLDFALPNAAQYLGHFAAPGAEFSVEPGNPLSIVSRGRSMPLQAWGGDSFRTLHPDFRRFSLKFERSGNAITGAAWGPLNFVRAQAAGNFANSDPVLARLAGTYFSGDPWFGVMTVVERGGELWIGTDTPMVSIGDNLWRVGQQPWSPERAAFADLVDGVPQTFIFSGEKFHRRDG